MSLHEFCMAGLGLLIINMSSNSCSSSPHSIMYILWPTITDIVRGENLGYAHVIIADGC